MRRGPQSWRRRQPRIGVMLALFLLAAVQAVVGWWLTALGDAGGIRLGLTLMWTAFAVWLACSLVLRLRRGERFRDQGGYGAWWHL